MFHSPEPLCAQGNCSFLILPPPLLVSMRKFEKFKIEVVELIAPARFEILLNCCAQNLFNKIYCMFFK